MEIFQIVSSTSSSFWPATHSPGSKEGFKDASRTLSYGRTCIFFVASLLWSSINCEVDICSHGVVRSELHSYPLATTPPRPSLDFCLFQQQIPTSFALTQTDAADIDDDQLRAVVGSGFCGHIAGVWISTSFKHTSFTSILLFRHLETTSDNGQSRCQSCCRPQASAKGE